MVIIKDMHIVYQFLCSILLFIICQLNYTTITCTSQEEAINIWTSTIGKELWDLAGLITKREEVFQKYKNVTLEKKDPQQIIREIIGNVSNMMRQKMNAVECILKAAEDASELFDLNETDHNFTYYRSNPPEEYFDGPFLDPDREMYREMDLTMNKHFYNIPVNINYSTVHVPTNIYHKHADPEEAIRWSEVLDETFAQNYRADPSLNWQYFGSATGIMRHYPAMEWGTLSSLFDCRIRTWFIEAATCTKDIVILLDNSGSMMGMYRHIAALVVNTILDTLSNNDYVNILDYDENVEYVVPCFEDVLVQATEENILVFKKAVPQLDPDEKSNVDIALVKAFELLNKYREERNCAVDSSYCNQAIMLITDGLPSNVSDLLDKYNRDEDDTVPIRIFTYLVGKEPSNIEESKEIACGNRGYHSHVRSLEQVTSSVYKYVFVLARPLVLQGDTNPLFWTHAYLDETFKLSLAHSKFDKFKLLTSVAGPAFDRKKNRNSTSAELLGVASTDVPLDAISRLMYPHKTGVNSHSFLVSNNGYMLKHPDLRPLSGKYLKDNYNSIDLTEVEQFDDDLGPREVGPELYQLRQALVNASDSVMHDIKIKFHYDDSRRISREINDYYYAPLVGTPFAIGFAIPDLYGNYSIDVGDEIQTHKYSKTNISSFLEGLYWKLHPKWIYCRYHYSAGHEYPTRELEFLHFVEKMDAGTFQWAAQYDESHENDKCGRKTLNDDDYHCDKHLVQRFVFDAKNTRSLFDEPFAYRNEEERSLGTFYNASLRFMATMSGLTRWENIGERNTDGPQFGDDNFRSIEESWYKVAVIQHRFNKLSFVYSVPFEIGNNTDDLLVSGTFAIFPKVEDNETPAAVIGLKFSLVQFKERFFQITSKCHKCSPCGESLDCYLVDHSGYIVISNNIQNTGKFFGEIDGNIMEAMIQEGIFEKITVRDYQALCFYQKWVRGSGNILSTPLSILKRGFNWILSSIAWLIIKINLQELWEASGILISGFEDFPGPSTAKPAFRKCRKCKLEEELWHEQNQKPVFLDIPIACEDEHDLYILNQNRSQNLQSSRIETSICTRQFYIQMIPHSNLLYIGIKNEIDSCPSRFVHTTSSREIVYENETTFPCQKLYLNKLPRRRLAGCFNEHPLERDITDCGQNKGNTLQLNLVPWLLLVWAGM